MRFKRSSASDGQEVVLLPSRLGDFPGRPRQPPLKLLPEPTDDQSLEDLLLGEAEWSRNHILGLFVLDTGTLFNVTSQFSPRAIKSK